MTGGSPCQDLSVAGKRAGLKGERSGLFMEQIRCVKELRQADVHRGRAGQFIRPRYMVWENVPGAFSSGNPKGADFAAVIEEIIKVAEPDAIVRVVPPDKGWNKSGCYYSADGRWSVAWRLHDAQFWGVPQRRKRIALVADFGGLSAPEILFERKGLSRDIEQSGETRKEIAGAVGGGVEGAISIHLTQDPISNFELRHAISAGSKNGQCVNGVFCLQGNGIDRAETAGCNGKGWREDVSYTLNTIGRPAVYSFDSLASNSMKSSNPNSGCRQVETAKTLDCFDPNPSKNQGGIAIVQPIMCLNDQGGSVMSVSEDVSGCLRAQEHGHQPTVYDARGNGNGKVVPTLTGDHQNRVTDYTALTFATQSYSGKKESEEGASVVRRLTPLECERLQGYPDGWTDIGEWVDSKGKKHKEADSPRYKALGNSIALPFWKWLLKRISAQYERDATLGSLFDGIGGFPYLWERINGKGSARWASEIEEFPIAVTKLRFGDK